jgi:penicillin-insensitive murein endopeptidase
MRAARAAGVVVAIAAVAAAGASAGGGPARGASAEYRKAIAAIDALQRAKEPSVSTGTISKGGIKNAAELPAHGYGYRLASTTRKTHFGADEMVFGLIELAAVIQERRPGSPWLSIGDIGLKEGGKLDPHINHQDGRDCDLAFLYCDPSGTPIERGWLKCDATGATTNKGVVFDTARNFEMLSLALESPYFGGFEWIFVHEPLKKLLLAHGEALAKKEPRRAEEIQRHAAELEKLLREPTSSPHDDHFHLRVKKGTAAR